MFHKCYLRGLHICRWGKKMKKHATISFALLALLLFVMLNKSAASTILTTEDEALVYVNPQISHASLGSTFEVEISIANARDIYSYEFMLYYDTNLLDCLEARIPEDHFLEPNVPHNVWIIKPEIEDDFDPDYGRVWLAVTLLGSEEPTKKGDGVLLIITFKVLQVGNCTLDLDESYTTLVNDMTQILPRQVQDGLFESETIEHETAVFLKVPSHLVPGESTTIDLTVKNGGQHDETDVELQLFIDNFMIDSMQINSLPIGSSHTLSHDWKPSLETKHNVTGYTKSLLGETNTLNNLDQKMVAVSYVIEVPLHFPNIQEAITAASSGDTIRVASGTYYEHVVVDKPVTLSGEDMNNTIIDGSGYMHVVEMIEVQVNGWIGGSGKISGFTFQNGLSGVCIRSHRNTIEDNIIKGCQYGILLWPLSSLNVVRRNTITGNEFGILSSDESHDNEIYHNNFIDNTNQAADEGGENTWGHEEEGNYWSDYNGTDTDQDDIGDNPYVVNATEGIGDNFPLLCFYVSLRGDLNDDGKVSMPDLSIAAASFATYPRHPRWNSAADINSDGKVNMIDLVIIVTKF